MPLLWVAVAVALMLALVAIVKLDAFFALLITSLVVGLLQGMDLLSVLRSLLAGIGSTLGSVALVLVFGAMLGALVESSGAARVITERLRAWFGERRIQLAMAATGLLVGLPMLYNAGFLLLIPLVYTMARATGLPIVYLGLPLASALSVTHGFVPPHPAPTFIAFVYHADVARTLFAGIVAAVPACLLGGVWFGRRHRSRPGTIPPGIVIPQDHAVEGAPSMALCLATLLVPVALMLLAGVVDVAAGTAGIDALAPDAPAKLAAAVPNGALRALVVLAKFLGNANVALFVAVLVALYTFGLRRRRAMPALMREMGASVSSIAMILLVIAAGGALSQVLRDGGVATYISQRVVGLHWNPLLLAFGVASLIRLAVGSATVAGMTTAGLLAPTVVASGVHPELMVLATGAGSLMFSHFNDTGFWMFKEYFGLDIRETFLTWSVMEMIVAVVGLIVALVLQVAMT